MQLVESLPNVKGSISLFFTQGRRRKKVRYTEPKVPEDGYRIVIHKCSVKGDLSGPLFFQEDIVINNHTKLLKD